MTDGHTRAVAAVRAGLKTVPLVWDEDELDWDILMVQRTGLTCSISAGKQVYPHFADKPPI